MASLPEASIKAVVNQFLVSALLLMKYAVDERKLKERIAEIISIGLLHGSDDQVTRLIVYGFELVELTEEEVKAILDSLSPQIKEKVMSTHDLLIEKGRKEERAKAQRLIEQERAKAQAEKLKSALEFKKMGVPMADIAKGLQLSVEEVEKL